MQLLSSLHSTLTNQKKSLSVTAVQKISLNKILCKSNRTFLKIFAVRAAVFAFKFPTAIECSSPLGKATHLRCAFSRTTLARKHAVGIGSYGSVGTTGSKHTRSKCVRGFCEYAHSACRTERVNRAFIADVCEESAGCALPPPLRANYRSGARCTCSRRPKQNNLLRTMRAR